MDRVDWDERADTYDGVFEADPVYLSALRIIAGEVPPLGSPSVLDLGCGTGAVTAAVLERAPGARIVAVDPAPRMRDVSRRRFSSDERVTVVLGSGTALQAGEGEFDFVVSNLALHHVPRAEKQSCAVEIARVLKTGGKLVYGDQFTDVEADVRDPRRARDLISKTVGWSLYALEHGGYEYMLGLLRALPLFIAEEGEYLETIVRWGELLAGAGFAGLEVREVPPSRFGMKVLVATLP